MAPTTRRTQRKTAENAAQALNAEPAQAVVTDAFMEDFAKMTIGVGAKSYHVVAQGFAVYDNVHNGAIKNTGYVVSPAQTSGYTFRANEVQQAHLVKQEGHLKVLDKAGTLRSLDIETGQVVQTWETKRNDVKLPQTALAQAYKGAGHEGAGNLLLGIANKNVSLWDFRTAQGAVAEYQDGHAYTSGNGFTAVATGGSTGSRVGTAVVADAKGGIKVFQGGKFSKASSVFAGLGAPITSIDMTCDNEWVVATTDKYLLVANMKALAGDKQGAHQTLLRLSDSDALATGGAPFRHARFSYVTDSKVVETCIAAGVGKHVASWNFRGVKLVAQGKNAAVSYHLTEPAAGAGAVLDSGFLHTNWCGAGQDVLVAATKDALHSNVLRVA